MAAPTCNHLNRTSDTWLSNDLSYAVEGSDIMATTGGPTTIAITGHSAPKDAPLQPITDAGGSIFVQPGSQLVL